MKYNTKSTHPEACKLVPNNAQEGVAEEGAFHWPFSDTTDENVNVIHVFVKWLQLLDNLQGMNGSGVGNGVDKPHLI